ncbi:DUF4411 family protein [Piscinibacter sakaiensis]|uniref:DUF4411 family protein n=1 Tax=Piscinibacter sakaiensis TaxID=1547922 RepID=A0A0K8NZR2_PISS1|nr:DUF4411 family protein [Piscinibacter sakaiensis]GAP35871.1 hypothetical protein ISF6_1644 [Piscinibacter sakaiensis]
MIYLLDANTLIEAKNRYDRMAVCPAYWAWIERSKRAGTVASIDLVGDELRRGHDELAAWAKGKADLFLAVSDDDTQLAFGTVARHVATTAAEMKPGALDEFLAGADPWLIAKAMALTGAVVVTHEQFNEQMRRKFSIPNVCHHFGVPWIDTFELLARTHARFVLAD